MEWLLVSLWLLSPVWAAHDGDARIDEVESATVRGRVLDPRGEPVVGAQVELRYHVGGPPWNWGAIGVGTDAAGRFESSVLPPGSTTAIARARDWASSAPEVFELEPGAVIEGLELVLRAGGRLTGEVFGPDGRPDVGGAIQVRSTSLGERFGRQVLSDAQGFFELEALDPGTYRLVAIPEELAGGGGATDRPPVERLRMATAEVVTGETVHVVLGGHSPSRVRLHGAARVAGRGPLELMVAALGADAPGLDWLEASNVRADGQYELVLDEPGDHLILLGDPHSGEPCAEFLCAIPAAREHCLDLEAARGALRGRVFGPDGRGVEGVPLVLHGDGLPSAFDALGGRRTRSGPGGFYAFELLPAGDYSLRAGVAFDGAWNPTGHAVAVSPRLHLDAGKALADVELELARPGTLAGVVLDSAGKPVVGATVFVRDGAGMWLDPLSALRTGAEGRFSLDHVAPGPVTAFARTADGCSHESAVVLVRAGEETHVRLVLEPGTLLRVRVADASGWVRASLRVLDELDRDVGTARDLERMRARIAAEVLSVERTFGPLAPGTYRVIASRPDGASIEQRVRLDGSPARSIVMLF